MSTIKIDVNNLSLAAKLLKGQDIITQSTSNPNVPGNIAVLAAFSTAQTALSAAMAAEIAARSSVPETMSAGETALTNWMAALTALASFTHSATNGNRTKIESAGFGVKAPRTPTQPLPAPTNVLAQTNGTPGHTLLTWSPLAWAKRYNVEISPNPITDTSWSFACSCTTAHVDVNGAQAGELFWYRVAGLNAKGQGPWSLAVPRPVM